MDILIKGSIFQYYPIRSVHSPSLVRACRAFPSDATCWPNNSNILKQSSLMSTAELRVEP